MKILTFQKTKERCKNIDFSKKMYIQILTFKKEKNENVDLSKEERNM